MSFFDKWPWAPTEELIHRLRRLHRFLVEESSCFGHSSSFDSVCSSCIIRFECHIKALCGWFKSSLQHEHFQQFGNPTSRQRVVRSSPFYNRTLTISPRIPHHGSVWMVQVLSTNESLTISAESHITAVCGWFNSSLYAALRPLRERRQIKKWLVSRKDLKGTTH